MPTDIDELMERLRKEEVRLRTSASFYTDADRNVESATTKKWLLSEADLQGRFIAAVEELRKRSDWLDEQAARYNETSEQVDRVFNDAE